MTSFDLTYMSLWCFFNMSLWCRDELIMMKLATYKLKRSYSNVEFGDHDLTTSIRWSDLDPTISIRRSNLDPTISIRWSWSDNPTILIRRSDLDLTSIWPRSDDLDLTFVCLQQLVSGLVSRLVARLSKDQTLSRSAFWRRQKPFSWSFSDLEHQRKPFSDPFPTLNVDETGCRSGMSEFERRQKPILSSSKNESLNVDKNWSSPLGRVVSHEILLTTRKGNWKGLTGSASVVGDFCHLMSAIFSSKFSQNFFPRQASLLAAILFLLAAN
jgi:hypothetical protein